MDADSAGLQSGGRLAESSRVEAFSDGVFAIALTLLVLDLRTPEVGGSFGQLLLAEWPAYLAYLAAFLNIAAIWINHHDLFHRVKRVDIRLICLNLFLLLVSSIFPWPAAVVSSAIRTGTHHDQVVAVLLFAVVGFAVPVAWIGLYSYLKRHPTLLTNPAEARYMADGSRRSTVGLVVFPVAAVIGLWQPVVALVAFVLVPAFFIATLLYPRPTEPSSA